MASKSASDAVLPLFDRRRFLEIVDKEWQEDFLSDEEVIEPPVNREGDQSVTAMRDVLAPVQVFSVFLYCLQLFLSFIYRRGLLQMVGKLKQRKKLKIENAGIRFPYN
jgi:hypothetical protein